jgi:hypothetical protein
MCTSVSHIYNNEGKSTINLGVDMHLWSCYIKKKRQLHRRQMEERTYREYIKLHIAVDTKSKQIISFRVTKGTVHDDTKKFVPMIKEISKHNEITTKCMQIKHMIVQLISIY